MQFQSNNNNDQSTLREYLIKKVVDLPISDLSGIKVIASALSTATSNTEQISRNSAVNIKKLIQNSIIIVIYKHEFKFKENCNQVSNLMVSSLKDVYKKSTLESLKQSFTGIVDTVANTLIV
jgi:hypothetical protein